MAGRRSSGGRRGRWEGPLRLRGITASLAPRTALSHPSPAALPSRQRRPRLKRLKRMSPPLAPRRHEPTSTTARRMFPRIIAAKLCWQQTSLPRPGSALPGQRTTSQPRRHQPGRLPHRLRPPSHLPPWTPLPEHHRPVLSPLTPSTTPYPPRLPHPQHPTTPPLGPSTAETLYSPTTNPPPPPSRRAKTPPSPPGYTTPPTPDPPTVRGPRPRDRPRQI